MQDNMADMKNALPKPSQSAAQTVPATFTLRDLSRQPAKVFETCDATGVVHIRTRDGRSYRILPDAQSPAPSVSVTGIVERSRQLQLRLRAAGFVPPNEADMERINRIIAGEE